MSLEHSPRRKQSTLAAPFSTNHPNQILTFREWCQLNRISDRTGRRLITSGEGPVLTQLSNQRIGISIANNAVWQKSRECMSPGAPRRRGPGRAKGRV
jgi:hypothetical protein